MVISVKLLIPIIFLLSLTVVSLSSCQQSYNTPFSDYSGRLNDPVQVTISLSKAPKIGESAELSLKTYLHDIDDIEPSSLSNAKAWLEFTWANTQGSYFEAMYPVNIPADEVLVNGNLSWQGAISVNDTIELNSTIKLPREGVWSITGCFTGKNWKKPVSIEIRIVVTRDVATVIGTMEFSKSPLAYLGKFGYGQGDYRPSPNETYPVVIELDISRAPHVNEEATLTCYIQSLLDIQDFSTQITFRKRLEGNKSTSIPGSDLLVNGVLNWKGNLTRNTPVKFSATIKFSEEGDWWIHAEGTYPTIDRLNYTANIKMSISNISSFGWENYP